MSERPQPAEFMDLAIQMLEADPHALDGMKDTIPSTESLIESLPALADVVIRDLDVDGPGGPVPARVYRVPGLDATDGFVWVHGGAFVFGDLDILESHWVALSIAARGVPVVALDYRKALNGVCFPAPSDDVLAGWSYASAHAAELFGVGADRVHLGGGSAGATLALGVAKRLRDSHGPLPRSLVGAYGVFHSELPPFSDELLEAMEHHPNPMEFPPETTRQINLRYVGSEEMLGDPYAFPGNGDVSGLPPVYLLNSEADHLRASGERLGRQLADAGVPAKVEFEPGTTHGHLNEAFDPAAARSIERIATWLCELV